MEEITEDMIRAAAGGDVEAFEQIYKASSRFVHNVAFRVVNTIDYAEEVTQEVFITIYRKLGTFQFGSSFKTWIYRVTVNTAINYAKKHSRHKKHEVKMDEHFQPASNQSNIEEKVEKEHNERLVESLLAQLNPDQRACVVLRNIQGLSYQEIADTLNININTVRSRLNRARETLLATRSEVVNNE